MHILSVMDGVSLDITARQFRNNPSEDAKIIQLFATKFITTLSNRLLRNAIVGLDEDFMVKAHHDPKEHINLISWLLNFKFFNDQYKRRYDESNNMMKMIFYFL